MENTKITGLDLGRVPPQSVDCEEAILGIIMVYPDSINDVIPILRAEMFYKECNRKIYAAAFDVYKRDGAVDLLTVTEKLRSNNNLESVGGPVYLVGLTMKVMSSAQTDFYAAIIKQKYLRRELIRHSSELQSRAFDESIELADVVEYAEADLYSITDDTHTKEPIKLGRLLDTLLYKIQKIINKEIKLIGKPSGFTKLDRLTGGFKDGELVIVAARPSVGKSAFALQIAKNCAIQGIPGAIFSLEMADESIAQRSLAAESGKTNLELMRGDADIDELCRAAENIINLPIYIDDTSSINIVEIRSKARKLKTLYDIQILFVDYLQLMDGDGDSREQKVASFSRGLKSVAKDLNIPVIALSQLSRRVEERADKRPILSDLRESGAIEQDADMVIFLYRASMYGQKSVIIDNIEMDAYDKIEIILAKNRNGAVGSVFIQHNMSMTVISDIDEKDTPF